MESSKIYKFLVEQEEKKSKNMEKQTMFPYSDRVIVRQIEVEFKSKGGILLGEIENDRETMYGKVVAVGEGKEIDGKLIAIKTNVGDIVVMRANAPLRINIKVMDYYTINESNLQMKLVDEEIIEKEFKTEGYDLTVNNARILS